MQEHPSKVKTQVRTTIQRKETWENIYPKKRHMWEHLSKVKTQERTSIQRKDTWEIIYTK